MLNAPIEEILKFMDMILQEEEEQAAKERSDMYLQYLITHFAQIPQGEETAERRNERDKLLSSLLPKNATKKEFKWGNAELDDPQLLLDSKKER